MTSPVVTVSPESSLRRVSSVIGDKKISCVVVEKDTAPVGILSERDLARALGRGARLNESADTHMTSPLITIDRDQCINQAIEIFERKFIRHLPVVDAGRLIGMVTQTNITRFSENLLRDYSRQLREEVCQQTRRLEEAAVFKDQMLGMAAHDLRTPITIILAWSELILASFDEENAEVNPREGLITILKQAERMETLLSDTLSISRIYRGKLDLQKQPENINAIIQDRAGFFDMLAAKKKITLCVNAEEDLPRINVDKERISEVIDNLLSNALKYSDAGDTVTVTTSLLDTDIAVRIKDTGQGISREDMPKLFHEFARLKSRPTANETSTGLGLAIVKKIVDKHGGKVFADSVLGNGSVFGFNLPVENK